MDENYEAPEIMSEAPNLEETEQQLGDDEIRLSDGRVVKMRETTGADETAVAQILGGKVSLQGAGSVVLVQANALKAIVSIGGQKPPVMNSYNAYLKFASSFKTRDLNRIKMKYADMNLEADENDPLV